MLNIFSRHKKETTPLAKVIEEYKQPWQGDALNAAAGNSKQRSVTEPEAALISAKHKLVTQRFYMATTEPWAKFHEDSKKIDHAIFDLYFPRIDMSFLKWRRKNGHPVFAWFSMTRKDKGNVWPDTCNIRGSTNSYENHPFDDFYKDVREEIYKSKERHELCCLHPLGHYPEEVRRLIFRWKPRTRKNFHHGRPFGFRQPLDELHDTPVVAFDDLHVICEVDAWERRPLPVSDPLLIGSVGSQMPYAMFWLLAKFDVTPLENIVASEWSH